MDTPRFTPANRVKGYFFSMSKKRDAERLAEIEDMDVERESKRAKRNADVLTKFLRKRYPQLKDKEIAEEAKISPDSLSALKNKGFVKMTPSLVRLCGFAEIDPEHLCDGDIMPLAPDPSTKIENELLLLARALTGKPLEQAATEVLRQFYELQTKGIPPASGSLVDKAF